MYPEPQLSERKGGKPRKAGERGPLLEYQDQVRDGIRSSYQQISRYYLLPAKKTAWMATNLLVEGRHESDHSTPWQVCSPSFFRSVK